MLNWANRFGICCFLDSHHYEDVYHSFDCLVACGAAYHLRADAGNAFEQLKDFSDTHQDWIFGHFGYDLKNEVEQLTSGNADGIQFPDMFFFVPEILLQLNASTLNIGTLHHEPSAVYEQINTGIHIHDPNIHYAGALTSKSRFSKQEYTSTVENLKQHILRGDCYEINFCQEFYAENVLLDPLSTFHTLTKISPNPFSVYYRLEDKFLLCASPERFLKKIGSKMIAQPMKGTSKRNLTDSVLDIAYKTELYTSPKEQSENVMVVDLVRNDLAKVCREGTVMVDELFGVYSFPQVHQMVSSVQGILREGIHWVESIKASFPMGSMTGAPKKRVMQLIEKYERTKRGVFSGAVGYVRPNLDFDFNVVIRSITYNAATRYLSFQTGSGITYCCEGEKEYDECLLKAAAIKKALTFSSMPL